MLQRLGAISTRNQRLILILGCAVLFGLWLSRVPLIEVDEVRYVETTREMFESQNFIIPHYNYAPRYAKPILYYWVQSASVAVFGMNEFAVRLPSALLGLLLVLILHAFLLRILSYSTRDREKRLQLAARGSAFLGAIGLAILPLFAAWTRAAVTDITLTFFITTSLLALLLAAIEPQAARRWYLYATLASALAFLTKGPIGLIVPGVVWLIFHLRQKTLWQAARQLPWAAAVLIFLLINLPWYVATYFVKGGHGFLEKFFVTENAGRFVENMAGKNSPAQKISELLSFLLGVVAILFPLNVFLAHDLAAPFSGNTELQRDDVLVRVRRFSWIWIAVVVFFITCSQTRGLNYVQSISAAVAILFAVHLFGRFTRDPQVENNRSRRVGLVIERVMLVVFGLAYIGLVLKVIWAGTPGRRAWEIPFPQSTMFSLLGLVIVLGVIYFTVLLFGWIRRKDETIVGGVMLTWAAFVGVLLIGVAPMHFSSTFSPSIEVGTYLRDLSQDEPLLVYMTACPIEPENPEDLTYYAQRKIKFHSSKDPKPVQEIIETVEQHHNILLVTDWLGLKQVSRQANAVVLKRFPFFVVARISQKDSAPIKANF